MLEGSLCLLHDLFRWPGWRRPRSWCRRQAAGGRRRRRGVARARVAGGAVRDKRTKSRTENFMSEMDDKGKGDFDFDSSWCQSEHE